MQTKNIIHFFIAALFAAILLTACNKEKVETPEPEEQELITTLQLQVSNAEGFNKTFSYKVENGFETPTPGVVTKDPVILDANKEYNVSINILNENETPAENITTEVIAEKDEHLLLFVSKPEAGAGAISFSKGSKDNMGRPFNQQISFTTGTSGNGLLTVTLKHAPTNKDAATPAAAGGETDLEAVFDVIVN